MSDDDPVDFLSLPDADGQTGIPDVGGQRPRVRRRTTLALWIAALVVVGGLVVRGQLAHSEADRTAEPTPSNSLANPAPRLTSAPSDTSSAVSTVQALANPGLALTDYVRPVSAAGGCVVVKAQSIPLARITVVLHELLPTYRITASARTLDEFAGLCSFRLRAVHLDSVVVIEVSAPAGSSTAGYDRVSLGFGHGGDRTIDFSQVITANGWTVLVGAAAPAQASLPPTSQLLTVAMRAELRW